MGARKQWSIKECEHPKYTRHFRNGNLCMRCPAILEDKRTGSVMSRGRVR